MARRSWKYLSSSGVAAGDGSGLVARSRRRLSQSVCSMDDLVAQRCPASATSRRVRRPACRICFSAGPRSP
eukprot:1817523-Lingulodinium_polyedra.AAC.1